MKEFSLTQCMALAHLHREMIDFLVDYSEGKLNKDFFLQGMYGLIDCIDNIIRENGSYNCSYSRPLIIKEKK